MASFETFILTGGEADPSRRSPRGLFFLWPNLAKQDFFLFLLHLQALSPAPIPSRLVPRDLIPVIRAKGQHPCSAPLAPLPGAIASSGEEPPWNFHRLKRPCCSFRLLHIWTRLRPRTRSDGSLLQKPWCCFCCQAKGPCPALP